MGANTVAGRALAFLLSIAMACAPAVGAVGAAGVAGAAIGLPSQALAEEPGAAQTIALGDTVQGLSLATNAPTQVQVHAIEVRQAGVAFVEHAITDVDGTWYLSTDTMARHTGYALDRETMTMQRYALEECPTYTHAVHLDPANHSLTVRTYEGALKDAIELGGLVYLPIHQVLPLLDCKAMVEDGRLRIERAEWSMLEVMHDLDVRALMFDSEAEFDGQEWAYLVQVGGSYLWENITNLKDAALRLAGPGVYLDYVDIFTSYVTDGDAYARASTLLAEGDAAGLDALDDALGGADALFGLVDSVAKDYERAGNLEALYSYVDEAHLTAAGVIGDGAVLVGNAIGAYLDTIMMVEDNQSMLVAIYPDALAGTEETLSARPLAAQTVWWRFETDGFWGTVGSTVAAQARDLGGEAVAGSILGFTTVGAAELAGYLMNSLLDASGVTAIDDLAMLQYHLAFIDDAYQAYLCAQTDFTYDQAGCERLRLTALGTLLASKACFEAMRDNNADNAEFVSYCDARIASITEACAELYLAGTGELVEGRDYVDGAIPQLEGELTGLADTTTVASGMTWRDFYQQNFAQDDGATFARLIDVTADGVEELVVSHYGTGEVTRDEAMESELFVDPDFVRIYQLVDGVPQTLFDFTAQPPRSQNHRVLAIATDYDGHTGIIDISDYFLEDGSRYYDAWFFTLAPVSMTWRTLHYNQWDGLVSYVYDMAGQPLVTLTDSTFNGPYLGVFLDSFASVTVVLNTLAEDSLTGVLGYANRLVDGRVNDMMRYGCLAEQDVWARNGLVLATPQVANAAAPAEEAGIPGVPELGAPETGEQAGQPAWIDETLALSVDSAVQAGVFGMSVGMADYLSIWFEGDASSLTMHAVYDDGAGNLLECVTPVSVEIASDGTLSIYDGGAMLSQLPAVAGMFNGAASYYLSYYAGYASLSIYADNGMWYEMFSESMTW